MDKRGQIAIFVIVAIVIVGAFAWLVIYPRISVFSGEVNPQRFLTDCIEPELETSVNLLSSQGGSLVPDNYLTHEDRQIQYLCYTSENYLPCVVQQPLLVRHVQEELTDRLAPKARSCMDELKNAYERQGYSVRAPRGEINISIVPGKINVDYIGEFSVEKENTQTFRQLNVNMESELYDLLLIATSIVEFESTLGDSETSLYLQYYPDLTIKKLKKEDDTIYNIMNVVSGDEFTFATRSLVWPSGYGVNA